MTRFTAPRQTDQTFGITSEIVPVDEAITLGEFGSKIEELPIDHERCSVSIELFSDATGTPTTASGGTAIVTIFTLVCPQRSDVLEDGDLVDSSVVPGLIKADAPITLFWTANTAQVVLTPDSIAGATHWRANVQMNKA